MKYRFSYSHLYTMLKYFWVAPMDAYLRAFEVSIWKHIKFNKPTLDIGCGDGRIDTYLFSGKTIEVGLDPVKEAVFFARKNPLYKKVVISRAEKIPFKDRSFNTIVLNSTLEHIKGDTVAIKEISRVLKRGGMLHFTTTTNHLKNELNNIIKDTDALKFFNQRVNHMHYRSFDEWNKILKNNDLYVEDHFTYFTKTDLRNWYLLFKIFTYKFRGRELWSYLKDSKFSKYIPSKIAVSVEYFIIEKLIDNKNIYQGLWQYISAKKV